MKKIIFILFMILWVQKSFADLVVSDLPVSFYMKSEITLKNGDVLSGYILRGAYGGCEVNEQGVPRVIDYRTYKEININDIDFIPYYFEDRPFPFYDNVYKLLFEEGEDISPRIAHYAFLETEKKILKSEDIKEAKVINCQNTEIAPILELKSQEELNLLLTPALANFNHELYYAGVVSLISYNKDYDTRDKLEKLLINFAKTKNENLVDDIESPNYWMNLIYDKENEKEFREKFLPKNVFLYMYGVPD